MTNSFPYPGRISRYGFVKGLIELLKPVRWLKNFIVILPFLFYGAKEANMLIESVIAALVFCLTASAVYIINDIKDVSEDRNHLTKQYRPLASGKIKPSTAFSLCGALIALSFLSVISLIDHAWFGFFLYAVISILYVYAGRSFFLLDVLLIGALHALRFYTGMLVIGSVDEDPFYPLLAGIFFVSICLALQKRMDEVHSMGSDKCARVAYKGVDVDTIKSAYMTFFIASASSMTMTYFISGYEVQYLGALLSSMIIISMSQNTLRSNEDFFAKRLKSPISMVSIGIFLIALSL